MIIAGGFNPRVSPGPSPAGAGATAATPGPSPAGVVGTAATPGVETPGYHHRGAVRCAATNPAATSGDSIHRATELLLPQRGRAPPTDSLSFCPMVLSSTVPPIFCIITG